MLWARTAPRDRLPSSLPRPAAGRARTSQQRRAARQAGRLVSAVRSGTTNWGRPASTTSRVTSSRWFRPLLARYPQTNHHLYVTSRSTDCGASQVSRKDLLSEFLMSPLQSKRQPARGSSTYAKFAFERITRPLVADRHSLVSATVWVKGLGGDAW